MNSYFMMIYMEKTKGCRKDTLQANKMHGLAENSLV